MDFDSPERDFPGLYESADGKSKKSKDESDYSEGDKKEPLIGRRKDKKDKGKDRGYAALEASSPEELDVKSPSKSKKSKAAFKFSTSKSKEKREKSRDNKEKTDKDNNKEEKKEKPTKEGKDKPDKEKESKKKEKDKEKDKKKEKIKQAQIKQTQLNKLNSTVSTEVVELGDVQPVFGVSVSLATERSRCHDGVDLPLVVRDCIDHLQAEDSLKSDQIYKVEPTIPRLHHFKRLYNNREERQPEMDELDIPTASGLLKVFFRELPEPILTTDLIARFEEVAAQPPGAAQLDEFAETITQLDVISRTLLGWILLHFAAVVQHEKHNKLNAQSLAMLLSSSLQMSHRLLVALLFHAPQLFPGIQLSKYVPPITAASPKLPETPVDIQLELRKQESLLAQIHAEMNAGFVSKKREEQLWEVQRIITQLKRKFRSFEKRLEKSMEEQPQGINCTDHARRQQQSLNNSKAAKAAKLSGSDEESKPLASEAPESPQQVSTITASPSAQLSPVPIAASPAALAVGDGLYVNDDTGFLMVPKTHPDYEQIIRLQLENQELENWKAELQARISAERAELLRLKQGLQHATLNNNNDTAAALEESLNVENDGHYDKVIEKYVRENALLENKKQMLAKEIFEERRECIALQVEFTLRQF